MDLMMRRRELLKINNALKDYSTKYLTFEALEDATTFQFTKAGLSYSLDNGNSWTELSASADTPTINSGATILFKGELIPDSSGIGTFKSNNRFNVVGNIMSLLYGDNYINQIDLSGKLKVFKKLFAQTLLFDASNLILPANILESNCYDSMFLQCSALAATPRLPATELSSNCYSSMFMNCTSLTTAPELPATTLANDCYYYMFDGCTSLTTVPTLPATTLTTECYMNMFSNCTSLVTAPDLPATTLVSKCYNGMFNGCTNLNYIKAMFITTPGTSYTSNWVNNVTSTGTFVKNSAATWTTTGNNGVPSGWTVQTASE